MPDKLAISNLNAWYDRHQVLKEINLNIVPNEILAVIGPAHSGKSTLLRIINRLTESCPGLRWQGSVWLDGQNINRLPPTELRRRIGLIFATPVPLPGTIFDNVAYGPRLRGHPRKRLLTDTVERCLRAASLWEEVKDRLHTSALRLSGGQQQRLCIARTLAVDPELILMDEPCSGLDPISTAQIENTLRELKSRYTFILVTNNTKQAARVSDRVAFFLSSELIELGPVSQIFTAPKDPRTDDYLAGRIG